MIVIDNRDISNIKTKYQNLKAPVQDRQSFPQHAHSFFKLLLCAIFFLSPQLLKDVLSALSLKMNLAQPPFP